LSWRRPGWATPSPRRRLALATLPLGDAGTWRLSTWATPCVDFDSPGVDFDLDLVNAQIRDGTSFYHVIVFPYMSLISALCIIVTLLCDFPFFLCK